MASIPQTFQQELAQPSRPGDNYLNHTSGVMSWAFTLDHKRVGVMFLAGVTIALFLGAAFALLIRTELGWAGTQILDKQQYNRVFTLHGAVMIFLVVIPAIPSALGNFVLPLMLGAKDVAFPRINLASFHFYVIGTIFFLLTLLGSFTGRGGLDTGWTFYAPYSLDTQTQVALAITGAFILGFGSIFTGINFIVTTHTMRPPGMGWHRIPLFIWSLYATAIIQVLATPVLAITLLLLLVERAVGIGVFNPELGGDPILFQHFFWFYSQPAVYIMILPAMGIISELISCFSRKHIFGYHAIAYSSVAIALLGFLVWGHHMFVSSQSVMVGVIFSFLTYSVAIPTAIKVFAWLATLYRGSISLATPMCYALMFIFNFGIGGLTGMFLGALAIDVQLHDTSFVVAHFHYTMVGGALFAFIGGIHYWWPKMFGVMFNDSWARLNSMLVFVGFNLTYFPQFIIGARGMPRRYQGYDNLIDDIPNLEFWQLASTVGGYLFVAGLVCIPIYLTLSLFKGKRAPSNPWGAATLDWQCPSPPAHDNFKDAPRVTDPYDFSHLRYDEATENYVSLPDEIKPVNGGSDQAETDTKPTQSL